jgi:hypothetical protein
MGCPHVSVWTCLNPIQRSCQLETIKIKPWEIYLLSQNCICNILKLLCWKFFCTFKTCYEHTLKIISLQLDITCISTAHFIQPFTEWVAKVRGLSIMRWEQEVPLLTFSTFSIIFLLLDSFWSSKKVAYQNSRFTTYSGILFHFLFSCEREDFLINRLIDFTL